MKRCVNVVHTTTQQNEVFSWSISNFIANNHTFEMKFWNKHEFASVCLSFNLIKNILNDKVLSCVLNAHCECQNGKHFKKRKEEDFWKWKVEQVYDFKIFCNFENNSLLQSLRIILED